MNDTNKEQGTTTVVEAPQAGVPAVRQLPEPVARRGITEAQWLTLCNTLFPGAASASVLLVWDYCSSRKLDPMKKPVHIVPMRVKGQDGQWGWRDVVMPGIYEYRITAHRTGLYLGHTEPEYGPEFDYKGVKAFEWCAMTFYRWNEKAQSKVAFPVKVYFKEVVALTKDGTVNDRWTRAGIQMHTKCTEAAGLRETFPEELGGEPTAEEMEGRTIHPQATDVQGSVVEQPPKALLVFGELPEGIRDTIEKAFTVLNFSPGARLTKLNEYFGGDAIQPEDQAQLLLDWLKDEYAKRRTGMPRAKKGNGKDKSTSHESAGDSAPKSVADSAWPSGSVGGDTDGRPAGAEAPAVGSGQVAPPTPKPAEAGKAPETNSELF